VPPQRFVGRSFSLSQGSFLTEKYVKYANRRGVAQPGSASGLGLEGRRFESSHPDHLFLIEYVELNYRGDDILVRSASLKAPLFLTEY
jgi:hypothetical protein